MLTYDVVIPTRNRERYLEACLRSVAQQTVQPQAVIVVDDGSTDRSVALLQRLARDWDRLKVIATPPRGVSAARNTALAASTADFVAFIDSDDVWHSDKLEKQLALFTPDRPDLSLVYCGFRRVGQRDQRLDLPDIVPVKRGRLFRDMLEGFHGIAPSTMVVRRQALADIGGFDEGLVQAEDRDACLKLARVSEFDCISEPLVNFRIHDESIYEHAMKHEPQFVLMQRLKVWNVWIDEINDWPAVLGRFRRDALATTSLLRFFAPGGLYHRLRRSDLALARRLFPTPWSHFVATAAPRSRFPFRLDLAKDLVARRIVAPNPVLLRLAHRFGRLKNLAPPRKPGSS